MADQNILKKIDQSTKKLTWALVFVVEDNYRIATEHYFLLLKNCPEVISKMGFITLVFEQRFPNNREQDWYTKHIFFVFRH